MYRHSNTLDISQCLVESVLNELEESEYTARICFLILYCDVLFDECLANGESTEVRLLSIRQA